MQAEFHNLNDNMLSLMFGMNNLELRAKMLDIALHRALADEELPVNVAVELRALRADTENMRKAIR